MAAREAPRAPVVANPGRPPGSVRRTTQIQMSFEEPGLVLSGTARDLRTPPLPEAEPEVLAEASVRAEMTGWERKLVALRVDPTRPGLEEALLGSRIGSGFRAKVRSILPGEEGSPLGLLLDDLPGAGLISGYVHMRSDAHEGRPPASSAPPSALERMSDICSGWRAGGTAMSSVARGDGVPMQDCPPAPDLDHDSSDPWAWHEVPPLPAGRMRRRRRIDVSGRGSVVVEAMFRDSYGEPDGSEVVLHEYTLSAILDGRAMKISSIEAHPRVLPFWECPLAAGPVSDLIGVPVAKLRSEVPQRLAATRSCTHLNDLLRVLADVATLVTHL